MTTWDTASKCPTCGFTGKSQAQNKAPDGNGLIHTMYCTNTGCEDKSIPWYVQTRSDGSVPDPVASRPKELDLRMYNPELQSMIEAALEAQKSLTVPGVTEIGK